MPLGPDLLLSSEPQTKSNRRIGREQIGNAGFWEFLSDPIKLTVRAHSPRQFGAEATACAKFFAAAPRFAAWSGFLDVGFALEAVNKLVDGLFPHLPVQSLDYSALYVLDPGGGGRLSIIHFGYVKPKACAEYVAYLAGSLRNRFGRNTFHFKIIDKNIERSLKAFRPDLVCLSSVTQNYNRATRYASIAKARSIPVIIGGIHISMAPSSLTEDMDAACIGERCAVGSSPCGCCYQS